MWVRDGFWPAQSLHSLAAEFATPLAFRLALFVSETRGRYFDDLNPNGSLCPRAMWHPPGAPSSLCSGTQKPSHHLTYN